MTLCESLRDSSLTILALASNSESVQSYRDARLEDIWVNLSQNRTWEVEEFYRKHKTTLLMNSVHKLTSVPARCF